MSSLVFQALQWYTVDLQVKGAPNWLETVVKCFGRTLEGKLVALTFRGTHPYFYVLVKIPEEKNLVISYFQSNAISPKYLANSLVRDKVEVVKKKLFFGYNPEPAYFVKLPFFSSKACSEAKKIMEPRYRIFEYNRLNAEVRLFHSTGIEPAGWIEIDKALIDGNEDEKDNPLPVRRELQNDKTIDLVVDELDIQSGLIRPCHNIEFQTKVAPFRIMAIDIETYSLSGGMTKAVRDWSLFIVQIRNYLMNNWKLFTSGVNVKALILASLSIEEEDYHQFVDQTIWDEIIRTNPPRFYPIKDRKYEQFLKYLKSSPSWAEDFKGLLSRKEPYQKIEERLRMALNFPDLQGDPIIQIGMTMRNIGSSDTRKVIITDKPCHPIEGVNVIPAKDESELLRLMAFCIRNLDPDVICGYNITQFDMQYIVQRAEAYGIRDKVLNMARFNEPEVRYQGDYDKSYTRLNKRYFQSSAAGNNEYQYIDMPGRIVMDIMKYIQQLAKLPSWTLNNVAKAFLNENKLDMPPQEMFRLYRQGDPDSIRRIAEYCIQDNILCNNLMDRVQTMMSQIAMANVCGTPVMKLFYAGQNEKLYPFVVRKANEAGYLIEDRIRLPKVDKEKYQGAIVLTCRPGIYNKPISVLDFNSLYPSCIIAFNMSPENAVLPHLPAPEGYDMNIVTYDSDKPPARFIKSHQLGIVPRLLQNLISKRKETRKRMESVNDPVQKGILNSLQNAYKVTANSMYGLMGTVGSPVYYEEIAASTTAKGREMLQTAVNYMSEKGIHVVYGDTDSVFIMFPDITSTGREAVEESITRASILGEEFSSYLNTPPLKMDYEKTYYPLLMIAKKNYAGKLYGDTADNPKVVHSGDLTIRRDVLPYTSKVYNHISNHLIETGNIQETIDLASRYADNLKTGNVPFEDMIMTVSYNGGNYANPDTQTAEVIARRMTEDDSANKPNPNDRLNYVIIARNDLRGADTQKLSLKLDYPESALRKGKKLDYMYYFEHQFRSKIGTMFSSIIPDPPGVNLYARAVNMACAYKGKRKTFDQVLEEKYRDLRIENAAQTLFGA